MGTQSDDGKMKQFLTFFYFCGGAYEEKNRYNLYDTFTKVKFYSSAISGIKKDNGATIELSALKMRL